MHRVFIGFIAIFFLFCGCDKKEKQAPLSKNQAIDLFVDIHLTDAMLMRSINRGHVKKKEVNSYYKGVLQKHGLTRQQFDSVVRYYSSDFKQFEKLYDQVITRIQEKDKEITMKRNEREKAQK